jgi:predicted adenylyl cyclase CyaB
MALEIEAKFRVETHEACRARLVELDAQRVGAVCERNHIFDREDRSLLVSDRGLRVREFEVVDGAARPATLTFKGRRMAGEFKMREEVETTVGDAKATCTLLESLGFAEALGYEKRRESWRLEACLVELDELPHLGLFIEIEGPSEEAVRAVQAELGFEDVALIKSSYIALLIQHCQENGLPTQLITFDESPAG